MPVSRGSLSTSIMAHGPNDTHERNAESSEADALPATGTDINAISASSEDYPDIPAASADEHVEHHSNLLGTDQHICPSSGVPFVPVFTPPRPRQLWVPNPHGDGYVNTAWDGHNHRSASTSDLCLDLVYVVLLSQLGTALRADIVPGMDLLRRVGWDFTDMFCPVWFLWNAYQCYLNRWETRDVFNSVFFVGSMVGVALLGVSYLPCGDATDRTGCRDFAWSLAGCRLWLLSFECLAIYHNRKYWAHSALYAGFDLAITMCWVITGFMPGATAVGAVRGTENCGCDGGTATATGEVCEISSCWYPFVFFWNLALALEFLRMLGPVITYKYHLVPDRQHMIPLDVNLLVERHTLFVIISMGEVVAASLAMNEASHDHLPITPLGHNTSVHQHEEAGHPHGAEAHSIHLEYVKVIFIVTIAAILKLRLFDFQQEPKPSHVEPSRVHALQSGATAGLVFMLAHIPLNMSIVLLGSVLEPLKTHNQLIWESKVIASLSVASILGICSGMELLHSGGGIRRRRVTLKCRVAIDGCFVLIAGSAPWWTTYYECDAPSDFLPMLCCVPIANLAITVYTRLPLSHRQRSIVQAVEGLTETRFSVYGGLISSDEFRVTMLD